jgi:FkbM family methyltransferase
LVTDLLGRYSTTVVNVGARWGDEGSWWRLDPVANLVGFEPDAAECARLNELAASNRRERYLPLALGAEKKQATLYETQRPECASIYPPLENLADRFPQLGAIRNKTSHSISLTTLNSWWEEEERPHISFIKLDTQGSELDILKGAENLLVDCLGCEVEVEFSPLYQNQPLFSDVDTFLRHRGFSLWQLSDLCAYSEKPAPGEKGRLYWANAVYLKDYTTVGNSPDEWRQKLVLAVLLEALGDHAAARSCVAQGLQEIAVPEPLAAQRWALTEDPI